MSRFMQAPSSMTKVWAAVATASLVAGAWIAGVAVGSAQDVTTVAEDVPTAPEGLIASTAPKVMQVVGTTHGDSFWSPEILTGYWPNVFFNSTSATTQTGEQRRVGTVRQLRRTMWAKWKAPESGFVSVSAWTTSGTFLTDDLGVNVYTGGTLSTLKRVASNDDQYLPPDGSAGSSGGPGRYSGILGMQVTKGTTYYLQVGSATDLSATPNDSVPGFSTIRLFIDGTHYVEPNDFLAKATTLTLGTGATVSATAYVNGSTMEPWEPTDNKFEAQAKRTGSVWYKWTAPQNGTGTLEICAYNERMTLAVFRNRASAAGEGVGDMSAVGFGFYDHTCTDSTTGANVTFAAVKGVTYFIQVAKTVPIGGYPGGDDKYGTLKLNVVFSGLYIEKITPTSGSTSGGTTLTFTGQRFATTMVVHFGSATRTILAPSETSFTVKTPAHSAGTVSVTITLAGDTSNAKSYIYK